MATYLIVLFLILLINLIPASKRVKTNVLLPFSFIILWIFLAFRYNYGLDYLSYYDDFRNPKPDEYQASEIIFWKFFYLFDKYYQVIIAHSTIICITLLYFIRRYVPPRYYSFFLFVFLCHPGLFFNSISALRSSLASMAFLWCADFFYIRKKRLLVFTVLLVLISFIHKSALLLLVIPLVEIIQNKFHLKEGVWISLLGFATIISLTSVVEYSSWFIERGYVDYRYITYIEQNKFYNSTYKSLILRSFMVMPAIYIIKALFTKRISLQWYRIFLISISFFIVYFAGFDFEHRLTVLLFVICIIAIIHLLQITDNVVKYFILSSTIFFVLLQFFLTFRGLSERLSLPGNYWFYDSLLLLPFNMWP